MSLRPICLLRQRFHHAPLFHASPQSSRHCTAYVIVIFFCIFFRVWVHNDLNWPIGILSRLLGAKLPLTKPIQDPSECLVRHTPLRSNLAPGQNSQLWDGVPCCLGRLGMMMQTHVAWYSSCNAWSKQCTFEVESELGSIQGSLRWMIG